MTGPTVDGLRALGVLSPLDEHFARAVGRLAGEPRPEVLLAAALVSRQVSSGHPCLDLKRFAEGTVLTDPDGDPADVPSWPDAARWSRALRDSPLVGDGDGDTPLVLDYSGRLYLRRYWEHECRLVAALRARTRQIDESVDTTVLHEGLNRLFPALHAQAAGDVDWQRIAAAMAVHRRLCVISGGPGTGKTFTVVKILALLIEQAVRAGRRMPRITLLAPTGKAALRLGESIHAAKDGLRSEPVIVAAIPEDATTIHRSLGSMRGSLTEFFHNAESPLLTDVVLVDEASMVDLALMSRLLQAVPPEARLILLGDKDQLASVEAGAVLADICSAAAPQPHSRRLVGWLRAVTGEPVPLAPNAPVETGIWDCIVYLTRSFRYSPTSGMGILARAINEGDADGALSALEQGTDVSRLDPSAGAGLSPGLRQAAVRGYGGFVEATDAASGLDALQHFRVLCALRKGPHGLQALNQEIALLLETAPPNRRRLTARPIIVTRNDYQLGLYNGDVGVIVDRADGPRAFFRALDGQARWLSPARLPAHEPVFAMSVHKSQGSEFDEVVVVLPERPSPVVSRELLYTAVTRARRHVSIYATHEAIALALSRRVERASGLRDALWER